MVYHSDIKKEELFFALKNSKLQLGGNKKLKIYGLLNCKSGKRMKKVNRVFFENEKDALDNGYRPCGHCMRTVYQAWKESIEV
jgi:methylphosphotriester-DNA--protein-cysteine methyltransferase